MNAHGSLTDYSVSRSRITPIGKGREGKGRETGGESYRHVLSGLEAKDRFRSNGYLPAASFGFGAI